MRTRPHGGMVWEGIRVGFNFFLEVQVRVNCMTIWDTIQWNNVL